MTTTAGDAPRLRGWRGAIQYGLWMVALGLFMAVFGGLVVWLLTGSQPAGYQLAGRLSLFAVAAGLSAGLGRWVCGGVSERWFSKKAVAGDFGSVFGCLAGIGLAGGLTPAPTPRTSEALRPGQVAEIAGPTLTGGRYDLADHRGKVVLVDFWATWCGPCVAELPTVRAVYDKYHADGFEVVAVNMDTDRGRLERFLAEHPEPWPQIVFDPPEAGWDNPLAKRYGVKGIPLLAVVGRDGAVTAVGVRGEGIERAVAEALGKPATGAKVGEVLFRPFLYLLRGLFESSPWLVLPCAAGLAVVGAGIESVVRRRRAGQPAG